MKSRMIAARGQPGCDGGVVHYIMERRRFGHLLAQLLGLLLGEAAPEDSLVRSLFGYGIGDPVRNVVGFGGPPEDRGPPAVGFAGRLRESGDRSSEGGCH